MASSAQGWLVASRVSGYNMAKGPRSNCQSKYMLELAAGTEVTPTDSDVGQECSRQKVLCLLQRKASQAHLKTETMLRLQVCEEI